MDDRPGPFVAPPADRKPDPTAPGARPLEPVERPPSRRRRLIGLAIVLIAIAIVAVVVTHIKHEAAPHGRFTSTGPMPVGVATVAQGNMPVVLSALGTVTPLATVTVQTQISGQLMTIGFKEGQMVQKGDFLAQIDPRPYQVALEQDQAQLAKDQSALRGAQLDLNRYNRLVAQHSIATQTRDDQIATVGQDRAQVLLDQSAIDTQKLNLVYCHITAPVDGRVGLRQVDPGNYVTPTSLTNGIAVVTKLQPISVIFTLPEDDLPQVLQQVHAGAVLQAVAYDRSGMHKIDTGQLATIDNEIDTSTGTVKLRALFNNQAQNLFPNQFVNIQLTVSALKNTEIVPDSAIQRGAPGTFVYVVQSNKTVKAQPITLGPDNGTQVAVTKGLTPGQQVVTDGADRLKDGAKITIAEPAPAGAAGAGAAKGSGRRHGKSAAKPAAASGPSAANPPTAVPPASPTPPAIPPSATPPGSNLPNRVPPPSGSGTPSAPTPPPTPPQGQGQSGGGH